MSEPLTPSDEFVRGYEKGASDCRGIVAKLDAQQQTIDQQTRDLAELRAGKAATEQALERVVDWLRSFSMPPTSTIAEKDEHLKLLESVLRREPHGRQG